MNTTMEARQKGPRPESFIGRPLDDDRAKVAFRAVKRCRQLESTLTAFARAITKDERVYCKVGTGATRTDGQIIWIKPPMKLGYVVEHARLLCGRRDLESSAQLCEACGQMDDVYASLFHEIAHIVFDSFATLTDKDRAELIARAVAERPGLAGTRHAKLRAGIEAMGRMKNTSYPMVCGLISPYLHPMVNSLEDARVNRAMYQAREGTYQMFRSMSVEVFERGIEQEDGTMLRWDEAPDNSQVIIGLYCKASKFDYAGWFKPAVIDALDDPELTRIVSTLDNARSVGAVYRTSFPLLERLRELGFCKRPEDLEDDPPELEPEPEPEDESDDDTEGEQQPMPPTDVAEDIDPGEGASGDDADDDSDQDDDEAPAPGDDDSEAGGSMSTETDDDATDPEDATDPDDSTADASDDAEGDDGADDDIDAPGRGGVWSDTEGEGSGDDDVDTEDVAPTDGEVRDCEECDEPFIDTDGTSYVCPKCEAGDHGYDDDEYDGEKPFTDDDGESQDGIDGTEDGDFDDSDDIDGADLIATGSPDDVDRDLGRFNGHGEEDAWNPDDIADEAEIDRAVIQEDNFDAPSTTVFGVNVTEYNPDSPVGGMWERSVMVNPDGVDVADSMPAERLINGTLQRVRNAFSENKKSRRQNGHRSGRVVSQMLPQVMVGNDKVFSRTRKPGKRDYFVCITLDVSGSTSSRGRIKLIREMGMALGELMTRAGIEFAMYAHSGDVHENGRHTGRSMLDLEIFQIKDRRQPWDAKAKTAVAALVPYSANLDGHTLEYMRRQCDTSSATNKIILYVTDGSMPAENYEDELNVLKRELATCRKKGYEVIGVGINNDEPTKYGLPTVRLDSVDDLPKLITDIEKRLAVTA